MFKHSLNSLIVGFGAILNTFLGLIFYLAVARALSPADFGVVSVILSLGVIVSDLFDFGLNTAIAKELGRSVETLNTLFTSKLVLAIAIVIIGLLVSPFISTILLKSANILLIWLGFISAAATLFFAFWNYRFIAHRKFIASTLLLISSNTLRLLLIIGLVFNPDLISAESILLVFIVSLIAVLPFAEMLGHLPTPKIKFDLAQAKSILSFSGYVGGSITLGSLYSRLDNFLLITLSNPLQTGFYTSVQKFFLTANQLPSSIGTVLIPDLASENKDRITKAIKFSVLISFSLSLLLVIFIIFADLLVPLILGSAYQEAAYPAKILALGTIFFILSMPASSYILYTLGNSRTIFKVTVLQLTVLVLLNVFLIPSWQASGAALSYFLSSAIGFVVYNFYFFRSRK